MGTGAGAAAAPGAVAGEGACSKPRAAALCQRPWTAGSLPNSPSSPSSPCCSQVKFGGFKGDPGLSYRGRSNVVSEWFIFLEDSIQYAIYILLYIYYIIYIIYISYIYIIIHHYISLYIIIYHYISLYIIIYHYISFYITIYHYISLYIIIYHMHFGRDEFALTFCGLNLWDWLKLPVVTH